jgi:hypothetical protein
VQEVANCGFGYWVDQEWPLTAKNAPKILWRMYHDSNNASIDERVGNANLVKEIAAEKSKIEKKYNSLVVEIIVLLLK